MVRKVQPVKSWWGQNHENNYVPESSQDLDYKKLYRMLGLGDGSHLDKKDDPIIKISGALHAYTYEAYPVHMPTFQSRFALIKEIRDKADALLNVIEDIGEDSYDDLFSSIYRGLGMEYDYDNSTELSKNRDIRLFTEFTSGSVYEFKKIMDLAVEEFPNDPDAPPKGRPPKTALKELITDLAEIYEEATGDDAYAGFASFPESSRSKKQEYDSAFFQFVWEIVSKYDPSEAKTNNALGSQIRSALTTQYENPPMTFTFEDDDEATSIEEYMNPKNGT